MTSAVPRRALPFYVRAGLKLVVITSAPLFGVALYEDTRSKQRYPLLDAKALRDERVIPERVRLGPLHEPANLVDVFRYEVPVSWVQRRVQTSPEQIFARSYWRSIPVMLERFWTVFTSNFSRPDYALDPATGAPRVVFDDEIPPPCPPFAPGNALVRGMFLVIPNGDEGEFVSKKPRLHGPLNFKYNPKGRAEIISAVRSFSVVMPENVDDPDAKAVLYLATHYDYDVEPPSLDAQIEMMNAREPPKPDEPPRDPWPANDPNVSRSTKLAMAAHRLYSRVLFRAALFEMSMGADRESKALRREAKLAQDTANRAMAVALGTNSPVTRPPI